MATLVLTTVGSVIGGPVGGAIGAILGQQVDQRLFAPKGREGPRLTDLTVQTSRYGNAIPKLYGTVRVSGTVVWSTDLIESRGQQSTGKGRPKTTTYSYSASFAVALSARHVGRIGRIWADGNLLRGAAGDFKTPCTFRLLAGSDDQAIDPLIAAAEGISTTPAYRGCAVAIFEDLQLADFGNRIPSLSFEVFADDAPLSVAALLGELSNGAIVGTSPAIIDGIAIQGDSVRGVAVALATALPFALRDNGGSLEIVACEAPVPIAAHDLGTSESGAVARISDHRAATTTIPESLSIAYYDGARDFQPGVQRARREGGSRREDRIDLAATLDATTAKAVAENRLSGLWRERRRLSVALPWSSITLRPGDCVSIPGDPAAWRIAAMSVERMVVHLELVPANMNTALSRSADAGRNTAQLDLIHGPTTLVVLDLPPLDDIAARYPRVVVAANGVSVGWRRAPLLVSAGDGASFIAMGATARPTTMGRTFTALGGGSCFLIDRINILDVTLINAALTLQDADDNGLLAGANVAMVGLECLQFGRATPLGNNRWRLSNLWRGRRGTDAAIASHTADEPFVLLEADALAQVPEAYAVNGVGIVATGVGDTAGLASSVARVGSAVAPLSPAHVKLARQANGDSVVTWIRRSREGWRWDDHVDVPIGEPTELYRVTRSGAGMIPDMIETADARWTYSLTQATADRLAGAASVTISIVQVGVRNVSSPTEITITLL